MKKLFLCSLVFTFGLFMFAGNAFAAMYTPSLSDLDTFYEVTSGTLTGPDAGSPITVGSDGTFQVTIADEDPNGTTWGDVQIGRDATIYLNHGWTDIGEKNYYFENTWTWVAPGSTAHLVLDLNNAVSSGGESIGYPIDNLWHVTSLGFNIGTNVGDGDYFGDELDGKASPVPIPTSVFLLGSGLLGLIGVGRFRFRKK
jgi:hypothetical protein